MVFAGIGTRTISDEARKSLTTYAWVLKEMGLDCRSGGAGGSDKIFLDVFGDRCQVLRPHHSTVESRKIAGEYHPAWDACDWGVKQLHGRNSQIILGENLDDKATFVLCAATSETQGGTSLGIKIARSYAIPVFNVCREHTFDEFLKTLQDAT